jgi:Ca2+/H+ antiporter, TMEM165/GDT1 family
MEAFFISMGVVAIAEIGDKTQLLAIMLAAKFRRPAPILAGMLAATLLNHLAAAWLGAAASNFLHGTVFQLGVGAAFLGMGAWALIPDRDSSPAAGPATSSAFLATLVAFFLAEIGDKTQIATSLLAARFGDVALVAAATTLGMMLANTPAVLLGDAIAKHAPLRLMRIAAGALFALLGVWAIATALMG